MWEKLEAAKKAVPVGFGPVFRPVIALIEEIIRRIEALEEKTGGKSGG